ncbi:DNA-directed RNA polymerase III subunit RPC5-like protein [Achlya hypogyna]|uniref:DNA-directed RNA polymerase III subunit RPC5-like protein n=1 Tax=Achlya hypogyna TaxID=1202772 RepID=A0A1V9ZNY7_ACHHY|nr:DNA-directed RNA polymerase III subunit RPC5-like protein [Achlya hypogyna]
MAEEDPVVCEIPVHLADILRGNLHVFQYPLRPVYRGMLTRPTQAKYKPENAMVTLDYPVNTETNYNADDHTPLPSLLPLTSSVVTPVSNYAVGAFRKGQLHLTPVTSIMQLRPSLHHLDEDSDEEEDNEDVDMEADAKPAPATETADLKEVQVQFKKRQSERALAAMQSSYAYKRNLIQSEKWIGLRVQSEDEDKDEFEQLFSETEAPVAFNVTPAAYLRALSYKADDDGTPAATDVDMVGTDDLDKKVLDILTTDKVLHFKELRALLPTVAKDDLRACIDRVATVVRGCVLPKSSLLKDHVAYRTALVDEFKKAASVARTDLIDKHNIPADICKSLLQEYAVLDPATRRWGLKRSDDNAAKW